MRSKPANQDRAREALDRRLGQWRAAAAPPPRGWIRAIREALGMSREDLAQRLGITRQGVLRMEKAEADGSIRMNTLRRAAEALGATVTYALVPDESLEEMVGRRAHAVARRDVERANRTMALEDQTVAEQGQEQILEELAGEVRNSARLWRD